MHACSVDHINASIIQLQEYNIYRKSTVTHSFLRLEKKKQLRLEREKIKSIHMQLQILKLKNCLKFTTKFKKICAVDIKDT